MTLRLTPERFRELELLAAAENRSPANFVETLVLRDLRAKAEDNRVITMFTAPELVGVDPGPLDRSPGETNERYAERQKLFEQLMALPDAG